MKVSFGDAIGSALEAVRGYRWVEFAPFFWILAVQLVFIAICSQLTSSWAMGIVAGLAKLVKGEGNIHYPAFFAYVSILLGWLESFLYTVPGAVLIPLSLLRLYSRSDRALSLGARAGERLAVAFLPTLIAGALIVGVVWSWQRYLAPPVSLFIKNGVRPPWGDYLAWLTVVIGGYLVVALLLYVPVAAVQARTNPVRAFFRGVRFGFRAWIFTAFFAVLFGLPAILIQWVLERQGMLLITRLRPELILIGLAIYAAFTSVSTYLTYATAARFYRIARAED